MTDHASATTPRQHVAFIGLGTMGFPMAGHLARAGHDVTVFNRTTSRSKAWTTEYRGATATSPADAARAADLVFTCVGNDDVLRAVVLGDDGALAGMRPGAVLVDHTTASARLARELHDVAAGRGLHFVDAPMSGGEAGAVGGTLTVMCGGDEAIVAAARPVLLAYSRIVTAIGPAGSGQLAKMVNQICIAGLLQGLSEGLAFGEKAGLDMPLVLDAIGKGAAQSWQMDNRARTMLADEFDFGFAVKWMIKDLRMALEEGTRHDAQLPVATLVERFYTELERDGGGQRDTSSLIRRLR
ncbi:MAG: NAD(P)-dependent oxidoreductase [Gammaproteobacteria bacterium PRO9]|nr:NAD(P)-dependent oxidoreductase [Gammaproteobacteria bacterium PRO9]